MQRTGTELGRLILLAAVLLMGCDRGDILAQQGEQERTVREELGDVPAVVDTTTAAALSRTFRAAAATALPSVVTVQVTAQPRAAQQQLPFPFGSPDGFRQGPPQPQTATGSGFVFTEDGHLITNNHVVDRATDIRVRFADGRSYDDIEVVGRDPNSDIAVLRINTAGDETFTPLRVGDSDRLQVGDWVIALGNPLNLGFTVTAGIVSAKGRNLNIIPAGETALESFIQTDAAINQGNSGGPLVDLYGRMVGVNTAIASPTGAYAGNGFAVPAAIAVRVASDIIEYGRVRRPQLGVRIQPVSEGQAELYDLDRIAGAFVSEVVPDGPAARAGLKPEDIIISLDGQAIDDSAELISRLARREPGERVTLGVVRDGRRQDIDVRLGEFDFEPPEPPARTAREAPEELLGVAVADATPQVLRRLELPQSIEGVVVVQVSPYGPAAQQLAPGDVILDFNRQRVTSVRELRAAAADVARGDVVVIRIQSRSTGNIAVRSFRVR